MKSTLFDPSNQTANHPDLLRMVLDLSETFHKCHRTEKVKGLPQEAFVKMAGEQWVIGKVADQRQVYVIITSKCATLMDAYDEVERLVATQFKNVFLVDN